MVRTNLEIQDLLKTMNSKKQNSNPKISLVAIHTGHSPQAVPLANAFLKSAALHAPVDITLIDLFHGQSPDECARAIAETVPAAVGFSMYAWNRQLSLDVAAQLRKWLPEVTLFAGGPEVTADPENVLKSAVFDFIISGEGEMPFTAFCQRMAATLQIKDIPGLLMPGGTIPLSAAPAISDLDTIPSPYLSGVLDTRSYSGMLWQLSRGCCFSCDFCFDARGRSGVRRFSLERLEAELRHFAATGVSQVFVLDSTFNQDVKRAKTILRMIRKIAPKVHFHFEVRSEFIDREMAGLFAKLVCSLQIGLQSCDPLVLRQVGRTFHRGDFSSKINLLNEHGAVFGFDLIYGLPGDSLQGFCNSLDFALSLYPNHLDLFPLAVLPGTALQLRSSAIGLEHSSSPPYTVVSSPTFSSDDMQKARQIATACDIFFSRGKAVAWFNGVMAVLGLKPSVFLHRFMEMLTIRKGVELNESDLDDNDVWNLQREFLMQIFGTGRLKRFLPLVLDLVDYHYHYAAALLAPQSEASYDLTRMSGIHALAKRSCAGKVQKMSSRSKLTQNILELPLQRAHCLQMARFNYEILDIIAVGAPDIRWMSDHLEPLGSSAVIYPHGDAVCTQSFDDSYYKLLESLDGQANAGGLASKLGIPAEDAAEFLTFALQEGFVVPQNYGR